MDIKELSIIVKWCGNEFHLKDLTDQDTVAMLKHEIMKQTQVTLVLSDLRLMKSFSMKISF